MSTFKPHKKFFVALLTLLAAIFACTALLHAQSAKATTDEPGTPAMAADPAFVARANDTVVRARKLIDNFFEETSNVVCTEDVAQTLVAKNNKPMYREESVFDYQLQSSSRTGSLRLSENREAKKAAFRVDGGAHTMALLARMIGADQMFTPVFDPFHRAPEPQCGDQHQNIFRIKLAANAKAAAGVALVQMQRAAGALEHAHQRIFVAMRHLGGAVQF